MTVTYRFVDGFFPQIFWYLYSGSPIESLPLSLANIKILSLILFSTAARSIPLVSLCFNLESYIFPVGLNCALFKSPSFFVVVSDKNLLGFVVYRFHCGKNDSYSRTHSYLILRISNMSWLIHHLEELSNASYLHVTDV